MSIKGWGVTLTKSEIKDVIKVTRSLENLYIYLEFYLKELLEKLLVKKENFSIFLNH